MRFILSILLLGSGLGGSAFAFSPDLHLGFESQFSRPVVTPSFFPILKAGITEQSESSKVEVEFKMSAEHPTVVNALSMKNAYLQVSDSITLGRKWLKWSEADETWGLGAFNALDSWDRLRSFSQGLTGVFAAIESDSLHFDFFATYLMLPEITPNVVIENHRFEFYHPQSVSAGPQTFDLLNRPTPLGYSLLIPDLYKILLRPGAAFSFNTKNTFEQFFARFSFAYLPLNYFPMALQASLAIPIDQIVVDLRPRLLSHALYSADLSYTFNPDWSACFSMMADQIFVEDSIPSDYTTATLGTTNYFSGSLKYQFIKLSQLYSTGGIGADFGPYANPAQNLFSSRILYRNATQIQLTYEEFTAKFLHEFSINANWIALDWKHQWSSQLSSVIGGDIISAESDVAADRGAEFLADLRALDRIRVGVNYVF